MHHLDDHDSGRRRDERGDDRNQVTVHVFLSLRSDGKIRTKGPSCLGSPPPATAGDAVAGRRVQTLR
ncbi:hypothetical protein GCM10009541_12280 [Micromonospora gifhornensis]|uniref:Uncharacterized protein n=1 Tax=Micromonospora gifhornensis TaxID=84594 RepID=A0ABQ4IET1_9ACTN|nr:hypothetical protein Vgi01_31020 [Micromonospora gifhornensis]